MPVITLLTDFGDKDGFTGAMKGVIYKINPGAAIADLSHQIPPGNISAAAFVLNAAYAYYPEGSFHVVVVDPGVGSERKALCVVTKKQTFIAPDNGVLQYIFDSHPDANVYCIENEEYMLTPVSNTFHGRDVFAPAAAHLSTGVKAQELGPQIQSWTNGVNKKYVELGDLISGEIIYIDHFGNLISNIPACYLQDKNINTIHLDSMQIKAVEKTYSSVKPGQVVALIGSHGFLEVAMRNDNAAECLGVGCKTKIIVQFSGTEHE